MPGVSQPLSLQSPSSSQPGIINVTVPAPTPGSGVQSVPASIDAAIGANAYAAFPAPWAPLSGKPAYRLTVTNNSVTCPVAMCVVDRYISPVLGIRRNTILVETWTVQPGETVTIAAKGLPKTTMYVVAWFVSTDDVDLGKTFSVNVAADNVAG